MRGEEVIIGIDGGGRVGFGHASRASVLARSLERRGAKVNVALRGDHDVVRWIRARGCRSVIRGEVPYRPGAIVILDRKGGAGRTEAERISRWSRLLVTIDDASPARFVADLVFDSWKDPTTGPVPLRMRGRWFRGLKYAIVDPRFTSLSAAARWKRRTPRLLVTLGGSDPWRITERVLESLSRLRQRVVVDCVEVPSLSGRQVSRGPRVTMHRRPPWLGPLLRRADLAVVGFGVTVVECLAAGVPCLTVCHARRDVPVAQALADRGLLGLLGAGRRAGARAGRAVERLLDEPGRLRALSGHGVEAVDGQSVERIIDLLGARSRARMWSAGPR